MARATIHYLLASAGEVILLAVIWEQCGLVRQHGSAAPFGSLGRLRWRSATR
jgi:hypothetical protein